MRFWSSWLLIALLLSGCSDSPPSSATDTQDTALPEEPLTPDKRHIELSGAAGDWVVLLQEFGGTAESFTYEYEYGFTTDPGARILTVIAVSNNGGDYGLSESNALRFSDGESGGGGNGVQSGSSSRGLAYAFASEAAWSLKWDSDSSNPVRALHVLRGSGTNFTEGTTEPGATYPGSQYAEINLMAGPDVWLLVEADLGDGQDEVLNDAVVPVAELHADLPRVDCDQQRQPPESDSMTALGSWGSDLEPIQVSMVAPVAQNQQRPIQLQAAIMPLGDIVMPDGWRLGDYCDSHGH